jgi:hypothetical protein
MEGEGALQLAGRNSVAESSMELLQVSAGGNLFKEIPADDVLLFQARKPSFEGVVAKHGAERVELNYPVRQRVQFRLAERVYFGKDK